MRFVAFVYRNAQAYAPGCGHVGLGVNAMHMVNVLSSEGVPCAAYGAHEIDDFTKLMAELPVDSIVVVEAFWLSTNNWETRILPKFPRMTFIVRCHSQVGFIQVEPGAIQQLREQIPLQDHNSRFKLSSNTNRFVQFVQKSYRAPCELLPNLYTQDRTERKHHYVPKGRHLRIGSFGALRILKMHVTAGAAAIMAAQQLGADLEFNITVGRKEGGDSVVASLRNMYRGLHGIKLIEHEWLPWSNFRRLVAHMDLCIQVSATESFNLVTADAISEGTPCVVGSAIDWAPKDWMVDIDDPAAIARKVISVVNDPRAPEHGLAALAAVNAEGIRVWIKFLARMNP